MSRTDKATMLLQLPYRNKEQIKTNDIYYKSGKNGIDGHSSNNLYDLRNLDELLVKLLLNDGCQINAVLSQQQNRIE